MQKKRGTEGNSLAEESRHRDWSGHLKKARNRGELTSWRGQTSGLVKTWKEGEAAIGTYDLDRADIGTSQDMQVKRGSVGNSRSGEGRHQDWAGHGNKARQRGGLTNWRGANIRTGQDMKTKKGSEGNSRTGEGKCHHWLGHGNKARR